MSTSQPLGRKDGLNYDTEQGSPQRASRSLPPKGDNTRPISRQLTKLVYMHRRLFGAVALSAIALGLVVLLLVPRRYTSSSAFVVEAAPTAGLSSAMAIISQLNPNLAGGDSPKFYVDLVRSRPVLEHLLVLVPGAACGTSEPRRVLDIIDPSGKTASERLANGVETLRERVSSGYDLRTGVITIGVEAECPTLARELADSLVASVNSFNIDRRQTRAKLRRQFSEQQARQADSALHRAEDDLSAFQSANRVMETPRLALESDRLRRRVTEREEMANALRREASTARLEEINSIPALTVIEPSNVPIHASFPKRRVWGLFVLLLGSLLGVGAVFVSFILREQPTDLDAELAQFHNKFRSIFGLSTRAERHHAG